MANEQFESVWDALADTPAEAADLRARSELMRLIQNNIAFRQLAPDEVATHCKITRPRIDNLLSGRLSQFDLSELKAIARDIGSF